MRCAILSDIHGNLDALRCVLADAQARNATDQVWCLGDLIGYGPEPNECVRELQSHPNFVCVAGNHDWGAIGRLDTAEFNRDAAAALSWTRERLDGALQQYIAGLPTTLVLEEFTLAHGSPRDHVREYVTHAGLARLNFDSFATPYCLIGHTHQPLVFEQAFAVESPGDHTPELMGRSRRATSIRTFVPVSGEPVALAQDRLIVNPGSVGQPRDGNPDAAYMLFDSDEATLVLYRVPYPVGQVQQKMATAGLPVRLAKRLAYGW